VTIRKHAVVTLTLRLRPSPASAAGGHPWVGPRCRGGRYCPTRRRHWGDCDTTAPTRQRPPSPLPRARWSVGSPTRSSRDADCRPHNPPMNTGVKLTCWQFCRCELHFISHSSHVTWLLSQTGLVCRWAKNSYLGRS